ncbi:hypothetical protein J4Q44_G00081640 [Coregonus suidteri]|uniref:Uncharacterized protein n=1 Tax=Coregonus suidteri TaxID=861788 RepID=A0AAN8M0F1_9TELE
MKQTCEMCANALSQLKAPVANASKAVSKKNDEEDGTEMTLIKPPDQLDLTEVPGRRATASPPCCHSD